MRKDAIVMFSAIVGSLILLSYGISGQNDTGNAPLRKWEYKAVHLSTMVRDLKDIDAIGKGLEKSLNDLGDDGWELCLEVNGGMILKRPE